MREDKQLCSTPDGMMYEVKFLAAISPKLQAVLRSCGDSTKSYDFDMAFRISSEGKIKETVYTRNQPIAACLGRKTPGHVGSAAAPSMHHSWSLQQQAKMNVLRHCRRLVPIMLGLERAVDRNADVIGLSLR